MRWARAAEALLGFLVCFCAAALGGVPDWSVLPAALLAACALGLGILGVRESGRTVRIPALAIVPLALAGLSLLQLLPLPMSIYALASPVLFELDRFALAPLGLSHWRPLSLDPPATQLELAKHLTYFTVLIAAHLVARDHAARRRLLIWVAAAGALVALSGFVHLVVGWDAVGGVVHFRDAAPPFVTPFGNPNHLAGYLTLGATVMLAFVMNPDEQGRRALWGIAYVLTGAAIMLSLSRGGVLAFVVSQLLFAGLLVRARRKEGRQIGWAAALGALVAGAAVAFGSYLASEKLWVEFHPDSAVLSRSKAEMWPELARAAAAFPFGAGRGAYLFAYGHFQSEHGNVAFTHAENALLQLATDIGWLAGILICVVAVVLGARALRARSQSLLELGALCGIAGLTIQNLFDFSLEYLACAVAACVVVGAAVEAGRVVRPRWGLAGVLLAAALAPLVAIMTGPSAVADETALAEMKDKALKVRAEALPRLNRHPADPWLYLAVANAFTQDPTAPADEALAWVNRALWIRPVDPQPHLVAARALFRLGKAVQAMQEYRIFFERGGAASVLLDEALPRARTARALQALLPPEMARDLLQVAAARGQADLSLAVLALVGETLTAFPRSWELDVLWARLLREQGRPEDALEKIVIAEHEVADDAGVCGEKARILLALGRRGEARALLKTHLRDHPSDAALTRQLAEDQLQSGEPAAARHTIADALGRHLSGLERMELYRLEADAYRHEGAMRHAVDSLLQAANAQPQLAAPQFEVASQLETMGRLAEAAEHVRIGMHASASTPDDRTRGEKWLVTLEERDRQMGLKTALESSGKDSGD